MAVEENSLELEPQSFSKQSQQFWTLQIAGWVGYAVVVFFAIVRPQFDTPNFNLSGQLINLFNETMSGFIFSYLQWRIIQKVVQFRVRKTILLSFISAAILGLIFNVVKLASYKMVVFGRAWYEDWKLLEFGGWLMFSLSTMFVWTAIFFIMLYNAKLQREHEKLLRAQTEAKNAQLEMLRYQLNPHFMFNTMNAISTLILKKENDTASEMLDKLCEFFRYSLDQNAKSYTSLTEELKLLDLYLSIEKVRFGERLSVVYQVAGDTKDAKVPSLLLQPLVENAIRYAIESKKENGLVVVSSQTHGGKLYLNVSDDGPGLSDDQKHGFGIGINNTKERLSTMFEGKTDVIIKNNIDKGITVSLVMPFTKVAANDG